MWSIGGLASERDFNQPGLELQDVDADILVLKLQIGGKVAVGGTPAPNHRSRPCVTAQSSVIVRALEEQRE